MHAAAPAATPSQARPAFSGPEGCPPQIAVCGLANSRLVSMIRYVLCVHVVLALAAAHLLCGATLPGGRLGKVLAATLRVSAVVSIAIQIVLIRMYTHGEWVA